MTGRPCRWLIASLVTVLATLGLPTTGAAAIPGGGYLLDSTAIPTVFSPSDTAGCLSDLADPSTIGDPLDTACDTYEVTARNVGSVATDGSTITLSDTVPTGLTIRKISLFSSDVGLSESDDLSKSFCSTADQTVSCLVALGSLNPGSFLMLEIYTTVNAGTTGSLTNSATVSGGGAQAQSTSEADRVNSNNPSFGVNQFSNYVAASDGTSDTQAGDHPYALTATIDLNTEFRGSAQAGGDPANSVEDLKDVIVDLPLGFLGSAVAAAQCTLAQLGGSGCPADSQVGSIFTEPRTVAAVTGPYDGGAGLYNLVPEHGVAAEFGYDDSLHGAHALYARVVPSPNGYVLQVTAPYAPQIDLDKIVTTFWGDPAQPPAGAQTGLTPQAMFTMPSACDGQPLTTTVYVDSWQHPGAFNADGTPDLSDPTWKSATSTSPPMAGCDRLRFSASMSAQPETSVADSPSGLTFDLKVPQTETPGTLATPPLDDASVTLPPGFTVNPSSAQGLGACTPAEIDLGSANPPTCPQDSQVGTVTLTTPLLPNPLQGEVYLASEFDNPFDSLIAGYIVIDDPTTGIVIKIPGNLTPNPVTGQITGVFDNNPQFPFSDLSINFKGGPTGVLATPESCGTFTTNSIFSPWSFPDLGHASTPADSFSIDSGCVTGFAPMLVGLSQNAQAGGYSPFMLSLSRQDTDQNFLGLSTTLPPGMLAKLAGVQECSEAQLASISSQPGTAAAQLVNPSCPAGSQVGTVTAGAGVGPDPFFLGGKVYLTGPYKGAPYGLAVVVPVIAGPFDLGTVVVRQALYVNPTTAQVTVVSDPFPTILDGIPLRIRRVDVDINRPDFTVNPTSCDPMAVTATAYTPLLSQPLSGKVYLVQGYRTNSKGQRIHTYPTLLIPLRGQIALDLRASTDVSPTDKLVTTFSTIPDATVSKFVLTINGGPKGLIVITGRGRTICGTSQVTDASFGAQSGKTATQNVTMSTPACQAKHAKHHKPGKRK